MVANREAAWGLGVITTLTDLPGGRLLVCLRYGPVVIPAVRDDAIWSDMPEGEPPDGTEQRYILRPARDGAAVTVTVEGRSGTWELDGAAEVRGW